MKILAKELAIAHLKVMNGINPDVLRLILEIPDKEQMEGLSVKVLDKDRFIVTRVLELVVKIQNGGRSSPRRK